MWELGKGLVRKARPDDMSRAAVALLGRKVLGRKVLGGGGEKKERWKRKKKNDDASST